MNIAAVNSPNLFKPLSRNETSALRSVLFRHLDGFPIAPTIMALKRHGVLDLFENKPTVPLEQILSTCGGNEGYLQVAMRLLCSQGWLGQEVNSRTDSIRYTTTNRTISAFQMADIYHWIEGYLPIATAMDDYLFGELAAQPEQELKFLRNQLRKSWGCNATGDPDIDVVRKQILLHMEGMLLGPILVSMGMRDLLQRYSDSSRFMAVAHFDGNEQRIKTALDMFCDMNLAEETEGGCVLNSDGLFFVKRAAAYGVTVSYLPMFSRVEEMLFGDPSALRDLGVGEHERHVDRAMNVWGSGGAHTTYFKKIDEIIIEVFNRPIEEQPLGIADMGCGDGTFLAHIFDVIWEKTSRANMLNEYPLTIVGSDYNQASIEASKKTLRKADVWANVIFGDIADPDQFAENLQQEYGVSLKDLLSVRSFLDHNRPYEKPDHVDEHRQSRSTGAFSHRGKRITNNQIEQNLVDHFKKWTPHVSRFGLLVLELHTVAPKIAALNVGNTNVTAYDGTHGFSDQYILEREVFLDAAREAGLHPDERYQARYPDSDLATVSLNLLMGKPTT
ncbi:MAG: hypothetical protein ACI8P9_002241 [Parasphingorhabdus sp.]|jgi:hypothetical protein